MQAINKSMWQDALCKVSQPWHYGHFKPDNSLLYVAGESCELLYV